MGDIPNLRSGPGSGPDPRSLTFSDISGDLQEILRTAITSAMLAGASADDARDVAQNIVLALCAAAASGSDLPYEPRAWVRVVAQRKAWALRARQSRELLTPFDSLGALDAAVGMVGMVGDGVADAVAERDQVLGWISRLPQEERAVIALSMDGASVADIADHLKITPSLARTRLRDARERLRLAFVAQLEEDRRAETAGAAATSSREDSALAALPPRQQEVLRLSRRGYKPAQIARAMAISPNTVRVNLFHARKRMRQYAGAA